MSARAPALVAVLTCVLVAGCGKSGTRVSGNVTFKGQPVPAGKIYFYPDTSKGNAGQAGFADIKGGKYDTGAPGGQGVPAGPVIVAIDGLDPAARPDKADKSGEATVKALFPRYETKAELPSGTSTKDFDVPASASQPAPAGPAGPIGP